MQEQDTRKRGMIGLIVMLVLAALVVILSNPIYRWLTGAGRGDTYTSVQKGYGGEVTVALTVEGSEILKLTAEGPMETPGLGGTAINTFNEQFAKSVGTDLANLDVELDGVSGATLTSRAVKQGLADVVQQAKTAQSEADLHTTATP